MRSAGLIITFLSLCIAFSYYVSYGRFHNSPLQQTKIIYQPTPEPTAVPKPIAYLSTQPTQEQMRAIGGRCPSLAVHPDIMALYKSQKGLDCGALTSNEALIDEVQYKKVLNCLNEGLAKDGCVQKKAYILISNFDANLQILVTTEDCRVHVQQLATYGPNCGFIEQRCDKIAGTFPFSACLYVQ